MSKVAKVVATVAAVVALSIAIPGVGTAIGLSATTTATVGAVAGAVSATAGAVAQATAKQARPENAGSINTVVIGANMPIPYAVGRTFVAGAQVYEDSGGTNAGGVQNAVRQQVRVFTAGGPVDSFESFLADFVPITFSAGVFGGATGYYQNVLDNQVRYGNWPETAHDYNVTAMPNWSGSHRLSGFASNRIAMWFDKTGERFTGGIPQMGMVGKWVKVYDPRKDSTYPGGSGTHRWDDESTWEWSDNGALHALTYARGRYIEKQGDGYPRPTPFKILGCGFTKEAVELSDFVEAANLAEANAWKCGGLIWDGPSISRWDNLKRFCETFAAQPVISGGRLRLKLFAPRPSLFTLTAADLVGDIELQAMKPFQERRNSVVYRYRSENHRWEHVQGEPVTISTYLTEDGELRTEEITYDLVQDKDQAAELATARLVVDRQFGPLTIACKPRLMRFRSGEAGTINLPEAGLINQKMVITGRQVDPASGVVTLTMESEPTEAEYAFALGQIGTAPPTPVIRNPEEVDQTASDFQPGGLTEEQLAQIASLQGLVDGNLQFFYSTSEPGIGSGTSITNLLFENAIDLLSFENGVDLLTFETSSGGDASEGDLWYNPDTSQWYQLENSVWVTKPGFGAIGAALIAAASAADGVADGKATVFYTEAEPTANAIGDLWIKPASSADRAIRTWNGSAWEVVADISANVAGPTPATFKFESDGTTAQSGQLPRTLSYRLIRRGVDITEQATWSVAIRTGTATVSMGDTAGIKGQLTISALASTTANLRISAVSAGVATPFDVVLQKEIAGLPQTGGTSGGGGGTGSTNASDVTLGEITSTNSASPTVVTDELTVTLGSTVEQARLIFYAVFSPQWQASAGTQAISIKAQRLVSSSWVDATSYITHSDAYEMNNDGSTIEPQWNATPGIVSFNMTEPLAGLQGTTQKYRFVGYISGGNRTTSSFLDGSAVVKGDGS